MLKRNLRHRCSSRLATHMVTHQSSSMMVVSSHSFHTRRQHLLMTCSAPTPTTTTHDGSSDKRTVPNYSSSRRSSQVELGFQFEKETVQLLNGKYGFHVKNTSKQSHDQGVDFYGTWRVSHSDNNNNTPKMVHILGQCKRESKSISVSHIRELQGTLSQFNNQQLTVSSDVVGDASSCSTLSTTTTDTNYNNNEKRYIGMLVSDQLGFSIHATRFAQQCSDGIILCTVDTRNCSLIHFVMNGAARQMIGSQLVPAMERTESGTKCIVFYETVTGLKNEEDVYQTTIIPLV